MKYEVTIKFLIPENDLDNDLEYMEEQFKNDIGLKKEVDYYVDSIESNYDDEKPKRGLRRYTNFIDN